MAVQISGNDITVPRDGTFTRNVTIGGTLTYEDVTNIDSVGLVTARTGIEIGARPGVAASISIDGNMIVSGISTFGGDVQVPDKIIHAGATDTAIRFSGADTVTVETGASERLRINSSGQLGLGASNNSDYDASAQNLLIASSGTTGITLRSGGSSYYGAIHFADGTSSSAEYRAGRILYEHSTDSLLFYNANTFAVKVDGSGNMGLGASSPTAASGETALHIYANEYPEVHLTSSVTGSNAGDGSIFTLNNDSSTIIRNQENSYIRFDTNGSNERMRILAAGGITFNGDTTAANALDDYEEGTWTPQSNIGSITVTTAHYVKIGSLVYFQAYLTFPSMSGSSEVQVTNFPFDVAGTADYLSCSINSDANVGGAQLVGQFNDGGFLVFAKPDNSKATIPDMSSKFVLFACTIMTH